MHEFMKAIGNQKSAILSVPTRNLIPVSNFIKKNSQLLTHEHEDLLIHSADYCVILYRVAEELN